jgi:hypothetical protein
MSHTVHVYYGDGDHGRWNHSHRGDLFARISLLQQITETVGRECVGFDGLQADFEFDTKDEALTALLRVRDLGVRAETGGVGEGPSQSAMDEAQRVMQRSYRGTAKR